MSSCEYCAGVTVIGEVNAWTSNVMNLIWLIGTFTFAVVLAVVTEDIVATVLVRPPVLLSYYTPRYHYPLSHVHVCLTPAASSSLFRPCLAPPSHVLRNDSKDVFGTCSALSHHCV